MKKKRLEKILELIQKYDVENQDVLIKLLEKEGFHVTQATICRDIKELDLIKVVTGYGGYKYTRRNQGNKANTDKYIAIFREAVMTIAFAGNLAVIKCHNGMARAACAGIDTMHFADVVGTIAGEDTIFVACKSEESAKKLCDEMNKLM